MAPVGIHAVAGADRDERVRERRDVDGEAAAGRGGKRDPRLRNDARAGHEAVLVLGPPEPLGRARGIRVHAHRLFDQPLARVGLVQDVEDRVVGELHRRVVPHPGHLTLALADAGVLGLADRTHAPGAVARAPPAVGGHRDLLAADLERAAPAAGLREAHRVEEHAAVLADVLARLLERGDRAVPGEVAGDPVRVRLEHEADPLERLHHLDAERPGARIHAVAELARRAHDAVAPAARDARKRVLHGEVRVLA